MWMRSFSLLTFFRVALGASSLLTSSFLLIHIQASFFLVFLFFAKGTGTTAVLTPAEQFSVQVFRSRALVQHEELCRSLTDYVYATHYHPSLGLACLRLRLWCKYISE